MLVAMDVYVWMDIEWRAAPFAVEHGRAALGKVFHETYRAASSYFPSTGNYESIWSFTSNGGRWHYESWEFVWSSCPLLVLEMQ